MQSTSTPHGAPAWRAGTHVADDVDEHAAHLSGWRQHYDQLGCGTFRGRLDEVVGQGVQLFREQTSHALRQRCELWSGAVWCGITAVHDGSRLDGRAGRAGGVMVSGTGFELVSPAGHDIVGFVVARDVLAAFAAARGRELDLDLLEHAAWRELDPARRHDALAHARAILVLAASLPPQAAASHGLHEAMLDVATDLFSAPAAPVRDRGNASSRRRLVQQARALVEADPERAYSVPQLCAALHVSRRTLQYAFEEEAGVNPLAYLRSVRLNGVRRLLRDPHRALSVQQAAAHWGFWNMSQFASDYRRQFGESASGTRSRGKS